MPMFHNRMRRIFNFRTSDDAKLVFIGNDAEFHKLCCAGISLGIAINVQRMNDIYRSRLLSAMRYISLIDRYMDALYDFNSSPIWYQELAGQLIWQLQNEIVRTIQSLMPYIDELRRLAKINNRLALLYNNHGCLPQFDDSFVKVGGLPDGTIKLLEDLKKVYDEFTLYTL